MYVSVPLPFHLLLVINDTTQGNAVFSVYNVDITVKVNLAVVSALHHVMKT